MDADGGDSWSWTSGNPAPYSGSFAHQSANAAGLHQHFFSGARPSLAVNAGDVLFAYVYIDPSNVPSELMLQWSDGSWEHRAYWGANSVYWGADGTVSRQYMGPMPTAGQWVRLQIPASKVGLEGSQVTGMSFTLFGGSATWDYIGKSTAAGSPSNPSTSTGSGDTSWVNDALPAGAVPDSSGGDTWNWSSSNPTPQLGSLAHQSGASAGLHQHFFTSATQTLAVNAGDKLYTYIYLDPANPPRQVMLQWYSDTWNHRAYWGANNLWWGTDGTAGSRNMGALPAAGQWVRLEVPASQLGLEGSTVSGMAFTLYGGRATWDNAGKSSGSNTTPTNNPPIIDTNTPPVIDTNTPPVIDTNTPPVIDSNPPPVVDTNTPPVVDTNPSTTNSTPPAASIGTNSLLPGTSIIDNVALQMPKPGDYGLHILSPTLLELKLINTKDPDPGQVSTWNLVNSSMQFTAPPANAFTVTANGQSIGVTAVGFKRRPLYAPLVKYDLRIENSLYLQLSSPLSDNQTIVVKNPNGSLWSTMPIIRRLRIRSVTAQPFT